MTTKFWKNKKILITGGTGFVGSHLVNKLKNSGAKLYIPTSKKEDLRDKEICRRIVKEKDIIIHLAGKVGGIGFNLSHQGEMFYDNIIMGVNLLEEARLAKVKKFVAIGTICAYPKRTPIPFKEENIWDGYPEESNAPYGLAKKMLLVQEQAYRTQYKFNGIYLLPVNMYGPGDTFDPNRSHVIPALIRKIIDAKKKNKKNIVVWGSGMATREFIYVEDAVDGIILATEKYNKKEPVNLGSGQEVSIKYIVQLICKMLKFNGKITWDRSKPDGQPRRNVDTSRANKEFGFRAHTPFKNGLKQTIDWYNNSVTKNKKSILYDKKLLA